MIPELGHFALILAFCFALLQTIIPSYGILKRNKRYIAAAKPLVVGQLFFCLLAFFLLMISFVLNDFSVAYVAQNSSRDLPFAYRMCAVWGGHEGSMLLWATLLVIWTTVVMLFSRGIPKLMLARVVAILGALATAFLLFILATSNPFLRLLTPIPENGRDLNPLLQDIGFWSHPPILYIGYVGFAIGFAFALSSLLSLQKKKLTDTTDKQNASNSQQKLLWKRQNQWIRWARIWTLVAWSFLTLGITLGSWWAYRVLGWGGWWFWDPVENASLMPWLLGTALIHVFAVAEKRGAYQAWTLFLAIGCFALSLLGTFLVRSGVMTSVHAFAVDPKRGVYMLVFLASVISVSWLVYAWRAGYLRSSSISSLFSRETMLLLNSVFFAVLMFTVLLGTLYPLFIEALGLGKISVGAPYFNKVMVPLMMPVLLLLAIGPHVQWQQKSFRQLALIIGISALLSALMARAISYFLPFMSLLIWIELILASWILLTTLHYFWRHALFSGTWSIKTRTLGMCLAHIGIAVSVVGMTLTSSYSVERDIRMKVGEHATLSDHQFHFIGTQAIKGPNYEGMSAEFKIHPEQAKDNVTVLHAQRKFYPIPRMTITEAAINPGFFRDIYIALGEELGSNEWAVRLYYKPFVRWIWFGGLFMLVGGLVAAWGNRLGAYRKLR